MPTVTSRGFQKSPGSIRSLDRIQARNPLGASGQPVGRLEEFADLVPVHVVGQVEPDPPGRAEVGGRVAPRIGLERLEFGRSALTTIDCPCCVH